MRIVSAPGRWLFFSMVPLLVVLFVQGIMHLPVTGPGSPFQGDGGPPEPPVQFEAGTHVLGFRPGSLVIAGGDHALKIGFDKANPVLPVRMADKVIYTDIWDGVTLEYERGAGAVLKSTYYISPCASPARNRISQISLTYSRAVKIDSRGNLVIPMDSGRMTENAPIAWQMVNGRKVPVAVAFTLKGTNRVGFETGDYDPALPLVIDPAVNWHTFHGSSDYDGATDMVLDGSGNIYVTGVCNGSWAGVTPLKAYTGSSDIFIAKFNSSGALQWHTFYGSASTDYAQGIALDSLGNIYVTGYSNDSWNGPAGQSPVSAYVAGGSNDAVAVKLDAGGAYQWHTFMGNNSNVVQAYDTVINQDGTDTYMLVTGRNRDAWGTSPVNAFGGFEDAFVAKINAANGALVWHTFMGGSNGLHGAYGIAADSSGNIYVTGKSNTAWSAGTEWATTKRLNNHSGSNPSSQDDIFVAKMDKNGGGLWYTFLGMDAPSSGGEIDQGYSLTLDGSGNVFVTGSSMDTWNGPGSQAPVNAHTGDSKHDTFVVKLNTSGGYQWHTFMGGSSHDYGQGIVLDGSGNIFVGGYSYNSWGTPGNAHSGGSDLFAAMLNSSGALQKNTFVGSGSYDEAKAIAVLSATEVFLAGHASQNFDCAVSAYTGGYDVFIGQVFGTPGPTACSGGSSGGSSSGSSGGWSGGSGGEPQESPYVSVSQFNNSGILTNKTIINGAVVTGGAVAGKITIIDGRLDNVEVTSGAVVTGGQVAGSIINNGTLDNVILTDGTAVIGGTLAGEITNGGTLSDVTVSDGARVIGGKVEGSITNNGTLKNVIIIKDAVVTGGQVTGSITNQGTLGNVILPDGTAVTGGALAGEITNGGTLSEVTVSDGARVAGGNVEGGITNNGTLTGLTIAKDAVVTGGILEGDIENLGSLIDAVLEGAVQNKGTIVNATLEGSMENQGTVTGITLKAGAAITGGDIAGFLTGDPGEPSSVKGNIQAGTVLSQVHIKVGSSVDPNAVLGAGVGFASNPLIPDGADLTDILRTNTQVVQNLSGPCNSVDLNQDVLYGHSSSIMDDINALSVLTENEISISQDLGTGTTTGQVDADSVCLCPASVVQVDKAENPPGVTTLSDGSVVTVTADGRSVEMQPAIKQPGDFYDLLKDFSLPDGITYEPEKNGMVTVTYGERSQVIARPDSVISPSQDAFLQEENPEAYFKATPSKDLPGFDIVTMVFQENGAVQEQHFYPAPSDWSALESALGAVPGLSGITYRKDGVIEVTANGKIYRGQLDYGVTRKYLYYDGDMLFTAVPDQNGDGLADLSLLYPNGDEQIMFLLQ